MAFVCLWFCCGWLVVAFGLFAFGVKPAFVRWHGGGWRLFAFGFGVVGWWSAFSRLWCEVIGVVVAGVCSPVVPPCFGGWVGVWRLFALVQ